MKRGRTRLSTSHAASLPAHTVVYAVGDIHGRLDLLEGAIGEIERGAEKAAVSGDHVTAIFLGDYIDRGPAAKGVLDRLIALQKAKPCETVFLRGNHEQFLLDMIDDRARGTAWLDYGGVETLRSYGLDPSVIGARDLDKLGEGLRNALPADHVRFLRDTRLSDERGDYLFVHAGLRPDRLLSEQSDADMLWFRYYGDDEPVHGKTVVHGHTPHDRPGLGRWRINIDTGAFESNALTALRLEGEAAQFLRIDLGPGGGSPRVSDWGREVERAVAAPAAPAPAPPAPPKAAKPPKPVKPARVNAAAMSRGARAGLMSAGALAVAAVMVVVVLAGAALLFKTRPEGVKPPPGATAQPAPPAIPGAPATTAPEPALAQAAPAPRPATAGPAEAANAAAPSEVAATPPPMTIAAPPPAAVAVVSPPPSGADANADAPISHAPAAGDTPTSSPSPSPSP